MITKRRINIFFKILIAASVIVALTIVGYISFIIYFGMNFANTTGGVVSREPIPTKIYGNVVFAISDSLQNEEWRYNLPTEWKYKLSKEESYYGIGPWYYIAQTDTTKELVINILDNFDVIFTNMIYVDSIGFYHNNLSNEKKQKYENIFRQTVLKDIEKEALMQGLPYSKIYLPKEQLLNYGYDDFAKEIYPD